MTARGRTTAETERGIWGQESQVSSDGDRGERRERDGLGESNDAGEGWSDGREGGLEDSEMEEDETTAGDPEWSGDTLTASPWGTQESGAGGLQGGARAVWSDTGKAPSAAANEEGARGRHEARTGQGEKNGGRRENTGGKTSGVRGDDMGHEASGVAHESPGVGEEEGVREASGVAENPVGGRHGVGGGVELTQGTNTPRVAGGTRGDKTPGSPTASQY